jgi:secondary thiamine-phosphate synthase enzyme
MDIVAPISPCAHRSIHVGTEHPTQFIDLTSQLEQFVRDAEVRAGILNVQSLHTTTAIVVNEHEPLLLDDFERLLETAAPHDGPYRHDDTATRTVNLTDEERPNGHAHCRALLLPTSVCLNIWNGRLMLGRWQRVFFVEFDGPRSRNVSVIAFGELRR